MAALCALGVIVGFFYVSRVREQLMLEGEPTLAAEPAVAR